MASPITIPGSDGHSTLRLYGFGASSDASEVREGGSFRFRFEGQSGIAALEPSELFVRDPESDVSGQFLPQQHVGTVLVEMIEHGGRTVTFAVEVGPAKLQYETEYRAMMEQIADEAAEATLQGFAPASAKVHVDPQREGDLRYRSLAFLVARLKDEEFQAAIERIVRRPHQRWRRLVEDRPVGRGLPAGAQAARAVVRPGRRVPAPPHVGVTALPAQVAHGRDEPTYDTPPNRFVRHAFAVWQGYALDMRRRLAAGGGVGAGPQRRGLRESEWLIERCDTMLRSPGIRDAGPMHRFPHGDTVLLRQPGYREVLRIFALAEASMALSAVLPDDPFSATQRNTAALYEYWCYIVLVRAVSEVCGREHHGAIFTPSEGGLSLNLQQGKDSCVTWEAEVAGRRLAIDLWFNRSFRRLSDIDADGSTWASAMRPDVSLRIRPLSARPDAAADPTLDVWLHFDAKYRLQRVELESTDDPVTMATRTDLLKMHAYRDVIRRSAGAYVLYPGTGEPLRQLEFHEVLPGIGAFPLRPGPAGAVHGSESLRAFVAEVLGHTANQASSSERTRFWHEEHVRRPGRVVRPTRFLHRPPADERVLVGYVRADQLAWVTRHRRYNVRADGRHGTVLPTDAMLTARLVLLWRRLHDGSPVLVGLFERVAPWQVASAAELMATGYPPRDPDRGYLVTEVNVLDTATEALILDVGQLVRTVLGADGSPTCSTWEDVARRW